MQWFRHQIHIVQFYWKTIKGVDVVSDHIVKSFIFLLQLFTGLKYKSRFFEGLQKTLEIFFLQTGNPQDDHTSLHILCQVLLDLYLLATSMLESGKREKYSEFNPDKNHAFTTCFSVEYIKKYQAIL